MEQETLNKRDRTSGVAHSKRKVQTGIVVSAKMDKTVVVKTERSFRHPRYEKIVTRAKKYYAHNENSDIKEGDRVVIMESS